MNKYDQLFREDMTDSQAGIVYFSALSKDMSQRDREELTEAFNRISRIIFDKMMQKTEEGWLY